MEGGRQLTNTRVNVVFQMESVVSALERNKARKVARSAWGGRGQGCHGLGNGQGRDLKKCGASPAAGQSHTQARGGRSSKGGRRPLRLGRRIKVRVVGDGVQSE